MFKTSIFFYTILNVLFVNAASAAGFKYDLALERVTFSEERLISGTTVRLYARVGNVGTADVKAYVSFYNGPTLVGESQVVSARANGFADEVFIDFVIPDHPFNIRAVIQGADPRDENAANDEAMTPLMTPIHDGDRDDIPDESDLCPQVSDPDQKDTDYDRQGDACDEDDDNDGITDARETTLGTNPLLADTDGDGVGDSQDAFPLDRARTTVPPSAPRSPPPVPPSLQTSSSPPPSPTPPIEGGEVPALVSPISVVEGATNNTLSPSGRGQGEGGNPPQAIRQPQPVVPLLPPKRERKRREPTRDERIAWSDSHFIDADNPRVWGAISLLSLLALASFIVEKVKARRADGSSEEPKTPLVPVEFSPPSIAAGGKPKKRTRKPALNKRALAKPRNLK